MPHQGPKKPDLTCDVLVVGGGTGGTAAAIWSARQGADTLLIEETDWLGGMLTAAGVCCFDGNNGAHSTGFFKEIRTKIEEYYGGKDKVSTGWVTECAFEPRVGNDIFQSLASEIPNLRVLFHSRVTDVHTMNKTVTGVDIETTGTEVTQTIHAKITIDATEYGDVIAMSGAEFRVGRESTNMTGEPDAPDKSDNIIQDVTYVAILKDYGPGANKILSKPDGFNPSKFDGATREHCSDPSWHSHAMHDWNSFITYGKMPNNKYMINWPFHANDYPTFLPPLNYHQREKELEKAKEHTLQFVYYIQTVLGHPELGLADDEFPTKDLLPLIPYCRESRRLVGSYIMKEYDVIADEETGRPPMQLDSIAIGDYFLDHHHGEPPKGELGVVEKFPKNAPFQVPYGTLVPKIMDGLMAAEKNISVTHIVNGCTRLQPIVLLIGQACGIAAALCIQQDIQPRQLNIKQLQNILLFHQDTLIPYDDIYPEHPFFIPIQKLALAGVMRDEQEQKFKPKRWVTKIELVHILDRTLQIIYKKGTHPIQYQFKQWIEEIVKEMNVSRGELVQIIVKILGLNPTHSGGGLKYRDINLNHPLYGIITTLYKEGFLTGFEKPDFEPAKPVSRAELALLIDNVFHPWEYV